MIPMIRRFFSDQRGVTMVEYGLIVACLSLAVILGFVQATDAITGLWGDNNDRLIEAVRANQPAP
jgi:pilus assembly protein Flp/PilA